MYSDGAFDKVIPLFYISVASPHLGTHKPHTSGEVFNTLQDIYLVRVGQQFSVRDTTVNRPLLVIMADPQQCFMQGLALFKQRVLFANTEVLMRNKE
jgi:Putative serine esterase (DUF676)